MSVDKHTDIIRVLLVDDEPSFLELISETLIPRGCEVTTAQNADQAIQALAEQFFDVVVLDIRMPGTDGLALLQRLSAERPTLQIVMLTGHATISTAVQAMRLGAFDFLIKPVEVDDLMRILRRAAERGDLERRNIALEEELKRTKGLGHIVGESRAIDEVHEFIDKASSSDLPVLITGETGTGKELVACAIHNKSARSGHPMVVVDTSTLRAELIASELFGHEKGAFTSASEKKAGLFEVADRGSIFLDEIGEMSLSNQASFLRVIESGTFRPVGSVKEINTDVRVITATNKDISNAVAGGEFRKDLYYRLKGLTINIAPLRERKDDIPLLAHYFLERSNVQSKTKVKLSEEVIYAFKAYDWPGNVRELLYLVELATLFAASEGHIKLTHLPEEILKPSTINTGPGSITAGTASGQSMNGLISDTPTMTEFHLRSERYYLGQLLRIHRGNKSQIAKILNISPSTLYAKLNRLKLDR